jgi:phage shock protein B
MDAFEFIIALVSIILGCVTLWVMMFYFRKDKGHRKPDPNTKYSLNQLSSMAESLQDRIDTLESILDAEVPDWREQNEQSARSPTN